MYRVRLPLPDGCRAIVLGEVVDDAGATRVHLTSTQILGAHLLALSDSADRFLSRLELAVGIATITWGILRVVDVVAEFYVDRLKKDERRDIVSIVPLSSRVLKFVISSIALIALLQNIEFDVTGLVAGLVE